MKLGDKLMITPVTFEPLAQIQSGSRKPVKIKAEVVYINFRHGWFTAEFKLSGGKVKESFKFC